MLRIENLVKGAERVILGIDTSNVNRAEVWETHKRGSVILSKRLVFVGARTDAEHRLDQLRSQWRARGFLPPEPRW